MVKRKIGILHVLDSLGIGGAEQLVLTLMQGLDRDKFHPVVCTLFSRDSNNPEPLADEIRDLGIRVEQLAMTRWRDLKVIKCFLKILDEEQIDIVHCHMVPANFWGCFLAKIFRNKKTVYTKHCILPFSNIQYKVQHFFLNRVLADRIIAISETVKDHLVTNCHSPSHKIIKIFDPVDTNRFNPKLNGLEIRTKLKISKDTILIGNTSRFEKRKGHKYFIEVAYKITATHDNVKFLAVGHGMEKQSIKQMIHELKLEDKIVLYDSRRDIPEIIGALDIFLFTSLWGEGFGISLAEAMAGGKAIVAGNVGPVSELIEDNVSGLLPTPVCWQEETDTLDSDLLAESVAKLIDDGTLRKSVGDAARKRAVDMFSASRFVSETEELYIELFQQ